MVTLYVRTCQTASESTAMEEANENTAKIRVLLADDHHLVRQGLRSLLQSEDFIEIAGEAANGQELVRLTRETQPDVVVTDVEMPIMNGIEAAREIHKANPEVQIIALSMHNDEFSVEIMLRYGARGYILKSDAYEELIAAIRRVSAGGIYLGKGIVPPSMPEPKVGTTTLKKADYQQLTEREREVLRLVAEGKSTKEIASELKISVKTADTHRQNIMNKLSLRTVAELTKFAIREGVSLLDQR